ncbi:MAG TPA: bifunctional 4-hydroxy-2-oxoglutarate aldolase/2-dehydro-3-deoxy-phosphogluconate aldolase [Thermoanaerobaculia bacterium]|nr:bifunctional 4-hydroxy-2-oxoglutarate aldolase/2-dehydro-3-deoxy-phosphogluconate aldolase [Thermoanaerobaculia bacterium]
MQRIRDVGLVPVVRAASADQAFAAIEAIRAGGIPILEITLTVPGAIQIINTLTKHIGDEALIGAGTVLDADTAQQCIDAGARFIVSPALDLPTIELCRRKEIPIFPGALTPTEVVTAWRAGANAVKVFPASAVGGATYLKSLKAPLPQIEMIPTGGVNLKNAADFIAAGAFALGIGADLVSGEAAAITEKARQYVAAVAAARS